MKIWTYGEMDDKIRLDLDLQDTDYIPADEMVGYANEAIDEIEATIHRLGSEEDYFLRRGFLPLTIGETQYSPPADLYAMKIRGIMYLNGTDRYPIRRVRRMKKFESIGELQYNPTGTEPYRWFWHNPSSAIGYQIELTRAAAETVGGTCTVTIASPGVFTWNAHGMAAGQQVRLFTSGALPTGLQEEKTYYVVNPATNTFQLSATSGGTAINTSGTQSGTHQVAKWPLITPMWYIRNANRVPLVTGGTSAATRATVVDIPEFANFVMQFMRVKCLSKEPDPRLAGEMEALKMHRTSMIATLSEVVPDDDDEIAQDLTAYQEHS